MLSEFSLLPMLLKVNITNFDTKDDIEKCRI